MKKSETDREISCFLFNNSRCRGYTGNIEFFIPIVQGAILNIAFKFYHPPLNPKQKTRNTEHKKRIHLNEKTV